MVHRITRIIAFFCAFGVSVALAADDRAAVGMRYDYGSRTETGRADGSVSILLLRGGYDFRDFILSVDVPMGLWNAPNGDEREIDIGNLTVELGRRLVFAKRLRIDVRLRTYLPTFNDGGARDQSLGGSAAALRPEEAVMWTPETLTVAPRIRFGFDVTSWLELSLGSTLFQGVIGDEAETAVHVFPGLMAKVARTGRLGVGYGVVDRIDDETDARSWVWLRGGFEEGRLSGGLEARLRQSPQPYVDAYGAQFAFYLGGSF